VEFIGKLTGTSLEDRLKLPWRIDSNFTGRSTGTFLEDRLKLPWKIDWNFPGRLTQASLKLPFNLRRKLVIKPPAHSTF
jgi:hypothetical protein